MYKLSGQVGSKCVHFLIEYQEFMGREENIWFLLRT